MQTYYNIANVKMKLNPDFIFEDEKNVFMKWSATSTGPPNLGMFQPTPTPDEVTWKSTNNNQKNEYAKNAELMGEGVRSTNNIVADVAAANVNTRSEFNTVSKSDPPSASAPRVERPAEEKLRAHYDKNVNYWSTVNSAQSTQQMLRGLNIQPKAGGHLLDLGCGDGRFSLYLAQKHGMTALGIDMSVPRIAKGVQTAQAHGLTDKVTLRVGDIYAEVQPGASDPDGAFRYDLIAAFEVLEHLQEPDKLIREGIAKLTPDGWFIGSVPKNMPCMICLHFQALLLL